MTDITDYILDEGQLVLKTEVTPHPPGFKMFNDGGVEEEVAVYLYGLVRVIKPQLIIETGTHLGISSSYMALALKKNGHGVIRTFEIIPELQRSANQLWERLNVSQFVDTRLQDAMQHELGPGEVVDFLFLDSEPMYRFDELLKYWPSLAPGTFIVIHDLHPSLGHHGQVHHGIYDWPYGDFRPKLGDLMKTGELSFMHFPTPRGLTILQKTDPSWEGIKYLRG